MQLAKKLMLVGSAGAMFAIGMTNLPASAQVTEKLQPQAKLNQ